MKITKAQIKLVGAALIVSALVVSGPFVAALFFRLSSPLHVLDYQCESASNAGGTPTIVPLLILASMQLLIKAVLYSMEGGVLEKWRIVAADLGPVIVFLTSETWLDRLLVYWHSRYEFPYEVSPYGIDGNIGYDFIYCWDIVFYSLVFFFVTFLVGEFIALGRTLKGDGLNLGLSNLFTAFLFSSYLGLFSREILKNGGHYWC